MTERIAGADQRIAGAATGVGGAARLASRVLAVGLVVGLLLGAAPLRQWTEGLPDAPWATALHDGAVWWEGVTGRAGLNWPYAATRAWLRGLEADKF